MKHEQPGPPDAAAWAVSGWWDEATLLARLAEQQTRLVSDTLARAAQSERVRRENRRLLQDLQGSLDRLQEVHHRVRNHLQMVTGLLSAEEMAEESPRARRALQKSVARLVSVAAIHDLLARDPASGEIRLPELTRRLAQHLLVQAGAEGRLRIRVAVAPFALGPREATAVVLIFAELIANAIEHGFGPQERGEVHVRAFREGDEAVLEVRDTGRGLPADFALETIGSLGLRLVARLAERDLRGAARAWSEGGERFRVAFPLRNMARE